MKKTLVGLLTAGLLLSTGAPAATAAPTSPPAPVRVAAGTPAERIDEMKEETNTVFDVETFDLSHASGGDVHLTRKGEVVIMLGVGDEAPQKSVEIGLEILKAAGKDVQITTPVTENNGDGLNGYLSMGTFTMDGQPLQWFVGAVEAGKKTLRMIVMGKDLKSSDGFKAFTHGLKKG